MRKPLAFLCCVLIVAGCDTPPPFPPSAGKPSDGAAASSAGPVQELAHAESSASDGGAGGRCVPQGVPSSGGVAAVLPADRATIWRPGVTYNGGIPCRSKICSNVTPSGGDDTEAINSALTSCSQDGVVQLAAGTFRISGQGISVPSNVTLRGRTDGALGRPTTLLVKTDGSAFGVIQVGNRYSGGRFKNATGACAASDPASCGINLAHDAVKGATSLTLVSNPGLKVGELVYLDMATNPKLTWWNPARSPGGGQAKDPSRGWFSNYDRPIAQILEIAAIAGNTITFSTAFHQTFTVADAAQLWQHEKPATRWAGVEDVYTFGGGGGDGGGNIHFSVCAYCWAKNVEVDRSNGTGINLDSTFRSEVRDSYIHTSADPNPGGGGYLTGLNRGAADNLLENNVVWNGNKVIVMRATGGGNVIAYNYMQDAYGAGYPTQPEVALNASHMTTPHDELFEGNEAPNFDGDSVWGGSIDITVFRNSLTGLRISAPPLKLSDRQGRRMAAIQEGHWWYTFAGNVLGYPDMPLSASMPGGPSGQTSWAYDATGATCGDSAVAKVWEIGWGDGGNWNAPQNSLVTARTIRDGNYDFVTRQVKWAAHEHAIPDSLYLGRAPAFFGSNPWPWVDPLAGRVRTLPAKARWQAMVAAGSHRSQLDIAGGF